MPDPLKKSISASQMAMVLGQSPYGTRFTLFQHFKRGFDLDVPENSRMEWGKFLEPFILMKVAERLGLEVIPNRTQEYHRNDASFIGCTRDALVICPSRGLGVLEVKAVDGMIFRSDWTDAAAPKHIEIQVQAQMMTPDPEHGQPTWGVIACLVGQNDKLAIYERQILPKVRHQIKTEAKRFFNDIANDNEPDPFGLPIEIPALDFLYPETAPDKEITIMDDMELAEDVRMYKWAKDQERSNKKLAAQLRPRILGVSKDARWLRLFGSKTKIVKSHVDETAISLPQDIKNALARIQGDDATAQEIKAAIHEALYWRHVTKKASIRTLITVEKIEDDIPAAPDYSNPHETIAA